jgi:hypothetical protein
VRYGTLTNPAALRVASSGLRSWPTFGYTLRSPSGSSAYARSLPDSTKENPVCNTSEDRATVGQRLDELEREVVGLRRSARRQRLVAGGIGAVVLAAFAVSGAGRAGQPGDGGRVLDELRLKRLAIIDDQGKDRIVASTSPWGATRLVWLDGDEKSRITASTNPDGLASVSWFDLDGKRRISAGTGNDGTVALPTADLKGKP